METQDFSVRVQIYHVASLSRAAGKTGLAACWSHVWRGKPAERPNLRNRKCCFAVYFLRYLILELR